ncbi:MAG TPA: sigma-70 family RNA polymerase sigma factor [Acidimicrobiales bacterium]|nr:sigma-70 family RNA polymerase sigma factor [Acidimicrobiales bacterium]
MPADLRNASDTILVLAIGRWNQDALAEAFRRHAGSVFAVAKQVLRDEGAAREVAHDAFVWLWHEPDRFDPARGSLRAFLLNFAHSRAIDRLRSDRRRTKREEEEARAAAPMTYDLEREVWDLTLVTKVRSAVDELPDDERKAIECAYFGGYTYRETATLLGQPEGTVKSRIRSGLRRLQTNLTAAGLQGVEL